MFITWEEAWILHYNSHQWSREQLVSVLIVLRSGKECWLAMTNPVFWRYISHQWSRDQLMVSRLTRPEPRCKNLLGRQIHKPMNKDMCSLKAAKIYLGWTFIYILLRQMFVISVRLRKNVFFASAPWVWVAASKTWETFQHTSRQNSLTKKQRFQRSVRPEGLMTVQIYVCGRTKPLVSRFIYNLGFLGRKKLPEVCSRRSEN